MTSGCLVKFAVSSVLSCCVWPSPRGSANIHVDSQQTPLLRPSLCARSLLAPSLAPFQKSQRSHVQVSEPDWGLLLGFTWFFVGVSGLPPVRGCPGAPCLLFCRLGLVPGRAWFWHSACAVRLLLGRVIAGLGLIWLSLGYWLKP